MLSEISDIKEKKIKEMGFDENQCNMLLKEKEEIEKVITEIPF